MVNTKTCIVHNCRYKREHADPNKKSIFLIPRDKMKDWLRIIGIQNNINRKKCYICEEHFAPGSLKRNRERSRLNDDAVPTLNLSSPDCYSPTTSNTTQNKLGKFSRNNGDCGNSSFLNPAQRREHESVRNDISSNLEAAQVHLHRLNVNSWPHVASVNEIAEHKELLRKMNALEKQNKLLERKLETQSVFINFSPDASVPAKIFARFICEEKEEAEYTEADKSICQQLYMNSRKSYEFMRVHLEFKLPETPFPHNSCMIKPFVADTSDEENW